MLVFTITEPNSSRPLSVMKLPLQTPTAWRIKKEGAGFYTLGALWCTMENRNKLTSEYMKEATRIGVQHVILTEKNEIVSYFTGHKDHSD